MLIGSTNVFFSNGFFSSNQNLGFFFIKSMHIFSLLIQIIILEKTVLLSKLEKKIHELKKKDVFLMKKCIKKPKSPCYILL